MVDDQTLNTVSKTGTGYLSNSTSVHRKLEESAQIELTEENIKVFELWARIERPESKSQAFKLLEILGNR